jgi:hypothetical protein
MSDTVFWSWQNDLPSKTNREFLRDILSVAVDRISEELEVEEVDRIELDHDTKSTPGMADIGPVILSKISRCAVMVADVTPISKSSLGKFLPNPNVMIELGYGLHALGYERIIAILNTAYGAQIEDLPFDIRHRRIMAYHLTEEVSPSDRKNIRDTLLKQMISAIKANLAEVRDVRASEQPISCAESDPSNLGLWRTDWPVKLSGSFGATYELMPEYLPRSWVRIVPAGYKDGIPSMSRVAALPDSARLWAPMGAGSSGNYGACKFGYVSYWHSASDEDGLDTPENLAALLEETGELWYSIGTAYAEKRENKYISYAHLLTSWTKSLTNGMRILDELGATKRRRVILGIDGMEDALWHTQDGYSPGISRKQSLVIDTTEPDWSDGNQVQLLFKLWNKLRDAFSIEESSLADFERYHEVRKAQ